MRAVISLFMGKLPTTRQMIARMMTHRKEEELTMLLQEYRPHSFGILYLLNNLTDDVYSEKLKTYRIGLELQLLARRATVLSSGSCRWINMQWHAGGAAARKASYPDNLCGGNKLAKDSASGATTAVPSDQEQHYYNLQCL